MTGSGADATVRTRRYIAARPGTYPAPKLAVHHVPRVERPAPEPVLENIGLLTENTGVGYGPLVATAENDARLDSAPHGFEALREAHHNLRAFERLAPPKKPRRAWASRTTRRILVGATLGGAVGVAVAMLLLFVVVTPGVKPEILLQPVSLWNAVDEPLQKFAALLAVTGFTLLGVTRALWFGGDIASDRN